MGSRDVHLYAHDLCNFLWRRRIASIDEENMPQPRDVETESESQFSDVVGRAILIICRKNRHTYWTRFGGIKDSLLQSIDSFVTALAVYARFFHSNYSSLVDSLLQFSALLLELIAYAVTHGREDYTALFPVLWEMTFLKLYGDSLPEDLNSRAAELASMHYSETCKDEMNAWDQDVEFFQLETRDSFWGNEHVTRQLEEDILGFNRQYEGKIPLMTVVESEIKSVAERDAMVVVEADHSKRQSGLKIQRENITECKKEFATVQEYAKTGAIPKSIIRSSLANSPTNLKDVSTSAKETSNDAELELCEREGQSFNRESLEQLFGFYENIYNQFSFLKNFDLENPEFKKELKRWLRLNLDFCEKIKLLGFS